MTLRQMLAQHNAFNPPRPPCLVVTLNHNAAKPHIARRRLKAGWHAAQEALNDQFFFHANHAVIRPSHPYIGNVGSALAQHSFIGGGNMRMGADHSRSATIEVPAKRNLLRCSLGVKIDKNNFRLDLRKQPIRISIGIVSRSHKHAALEIDDRIGHAILLSFIDSPTGQGRRKISRPQQSARGTMRVAVGHLKIFNDLALIPNVIPGSHHIDAKIEELFRKRRRDPKPSRRVLAIGNHEVSRMRTYKLRQTILNNSPSRTPKNVANKKDFQDLMVPREKREEVQALRAYKAITRRFQPSSKSRSFRMDSGSHSALACCAPVHYRSTIN